MIVGTAPPTVVLTAAASTRACSGICSRARNACCSASLAGTVDVELGAPVGTSALAMRGLDPVFQVLGTVPPLAWLPRSLAVFWDAQPSAFFVMFITAIWMFITAIWPVIINTAVGVRDVPQDYRNVARVVRLRGIGFFTKIVLPFAAPNILTGLRIGIGLVGFVLDRCVVLAGRLVTSGTSA